MKRYKIAIVKTDKYRYPKEGTFRPSEEYPEYLFKKELAGEKNHIYEMVREGFHMMGYDSGNYNKASWNPLGDLIEPGNMVVIKPNMVLDVNDSGEGTDCLFTQPAVVAAVIDYVLIALKGRGKIIIGDAPVQRCNFEKLVDDSGYGRLLEFYQNRIGEDIQISLKDFRELTSVVKNGIHEMAISEEKKGIIVELGKESEFAGETKKFFENIRITNYDPQILKQHHNQNKNEYYINADILAADVIINMPKPKTHRKAGVTISLKNMVGISARKEYLPHHTNGSVREGGDAYKEASRLKRIEDILLDKRNYYSQTKRAYGKARLMNWMMGRVRLLNRIYPYDDGQREGNWYGNDTISRTIIDLNKIIFYADKHGVLQETKQRKYLIVADMIISGEKEGPLAPSAKDVGIIAIGENPVCFDEILAKMMGAKIEYIHTLRHGRDIRGKYILVAQNEEGYIVSNYALWNGKTVKELERNTCLFFQPTEGWCEAFMKE